MCHWPMPHPREYHHPATPTPFQSAVGLGLYAWPGSIQLGEFPAGGAMVTSYDELPGFVEKQVCAEVRPFAYIDNWE